MRQIVQDRGKGRLRIEEIPAPVATPGQVVIANGASLISAGTEKMIRELAQSSLIEKARQRPDQVRRVLQKLRQEGLGKTLQDVRSKLSEPQSLGYSSAGVVVACGRGVRGIRPGDRAASNGSHAEVVSVPQHLCALVPDGVSDEHAAFTVVGSIALQGVRLSEVRLGETVLVLGLGLVGQICVSLLRASGCRVIGTDLDPDKCRLAQEMGADIARENMNSRDILDLTGDLGVDAVVIAAATPSSAPVVMAGEAVRKRGRVVVVGAVGMDLPRNLYYEKEAEIVVSCSYGPGRYDPEYEEQGRDYPRPYVRWTEQRNMQSVLDLIASKALDVSPLISHRFSVEEAEDAYRLIERGDEAYLGIILQYPQSCDRVTERTISLRSGEVTSAVGVACIGAGSFARSVLLPAIANAGDSLRRAVLCSARGLSAADSGRALGFESVTSDESVVYDHPDVGAVFIATRHDEHARQVVRALNAGKHVFVEKPLALTVEELATIEDALLEHRDRAPLLMVGFNRRFSPNVERLKKTFEGVTAPLTVSYRFNAGQIPSDHWTQSEEMGGGRIIGEACHAIDVVTYLTGSVPVRVHAESIGGTHAPPVTDDQCFITLRHRDGSISSVAYLAGGDRAYPKERIEVFGSGRVGVIDDFRGVVTVVGGRTRKHRSFHQDKGHRHEVRLFGEAITKGSLPPIPWNELRAVSLASILAVRSLREGIPFEIPDGPAAVEGTTPG